MRREQANKTGRWAIISGIIGLVAVGLLIAALAAPTPEAGGMRRETSLFAWQNAAVVLQALCMIPVAQGLGRVRLGLFAQGTLILASALMLVNVVSDMLYMAPIGLVGLWLLLANRTQDGPMSRGVAWTGRVAGAGLLAVGAGFLIYGLLVAPAVFVRPLTPTEIDAQSLTTPNLIAHLLMAAGTLLGRLVYPVWAIVLGLGLMKRNDGAT